MNGVAFDLALFTNLSQDHLDYHGSMHVYAETKARLFFFPGLKQAILNLDDAFGLELLTRVVRAGFRCRAMASRSGWQAAREQSVPVVQENLEISERGIAFDVDSLGKRG